jgi:photosystem II stability/assembly factor-like uncharacterized protein
VIFTCGYGSINGAYRIQTSYTTDNGRTWIHDTIMDSIARANVVVFDPFVPNRVLIGGDSVYSYKLLLVSSDLGTTWEHAGNGLSGIVYCLVPSFRTRGRFYAGTSQGLFYSNDGGINWSRTGTFTMVRAVAIDGENDSLIYAGTSSGIYVSTDAGTGWQQQNEGLVITDILSLAFRSQTPRTVFAGTNGSGAYFVTPPTGIGASPGPAGAGQFSLRVVPNPAKTRFKLMVQVPDGQTVSGGVYEPTGRLVQILKPAVGAGGWVQYPVDMTAKASGVYFIRVKTGTSETNARLVISD